MKILIFSRLYPPSVGGLENVMSILAREFCQLGHDVTVITNSTGILSDSQVRVLRKVNFISLISEIKKASIILHANISLREIWLPLLLHKSIFVVHHTWYRRPDGKVSLVDKLKLFLSNYVTNISVSNSISLHLPVASLVVENPYDAKCFEVMSDESNRPMDIIAVGRLVSDKGFDVLLDALSLINNEKLAVTIVGDGPERESLESKAKLLSHDVKFTGIKSQMEVARLLQLHKIMVIPSVWEEPFGIVALEGLASGCKVICSDVGGLPDAVGDFGIIIPAKNPSILSSSIISALRSEEVINKHRLKEHLTKHDPESVAKKYISIFEQKIA